MVDSEQQYIRHEIKEVTFLVLLGVFMAIILPLAIGFGFKVFQESFIQGRALEFGDFIVAFMIYYIMILGGILGLSALKINQLIKTDRNEHPAEQSKPSLFSVAYLHDPERDGLLYSLSDFMGFKEKRNFMFWSRSILRSFLLAFIISGIISIFQLVADIKFSGIPSLAFITTNIGQIGFSTEPTAFAETILMVFLFSSLMGVGSFLASKYKLGKAFYFGFGIIVCILIGAGWLAFHGIVYGNDEQALGSTFLFGFLGSFATLLFGTFIYWYVWHFNNNLVVALKNLAVSNEDIIFILILLIIFIGFAWLVGEVILRRIKKKIEYQPPDVQ